MKASKTLSAFFNGAGFYLVLCLALAVIGISGYFLYTTLVSRSSPAQEEATAGTVLAEEQAEHQTADVETHGDTAAAQSLPEQETAAVSSTTPVETHTAEDETSLQIAAPLSGDTLTPFSMDALLYNATLNDWRTHDGVDIAAQEGEAVHAAAAGKVLSVTEDYWLGKTVTISCADGCELTYASLQTTDVTAGQEVQTGDTIGAAGITALLEENLGPHLHFSVTRDGVALDPAQYLAQDN